MSHPQVPTIFESFNARALKPSQVAQTFVPSRHYETLCKRRHTVIVGPRGSGKTTLLKMLQQPALESWHHSDAPHYRSIIDFTGVFVATDVSWGAQIESLGGSRLDENTRIALGTAAFTTQVLRAFVIAMLQRVGQGAGGTTMQFRRVRATANAEAEIVSQLIEPWEIRPTIPTFLSLKHALTRRLADIQRLASEEVVRGEIGRADRIANLGFLHLHFVKACSVAAELFEDITETEEGKWALMFDELELAPDWIRGELVRSLRTTDDRFLFKLALSPFSHDVSLMDSATAPAAGQDYDEVRLWYAEKREGYEFCENLWYSMLSGRTISKVPPESVLGPSDFETPSEEWAGAGTAYAPGSRLSQRFIDLAKIDDSFAAYLKGREIDPRQLHRLSGDMRAAEVRKIAPLVALRHFYLKRNKSDARPVQRRSRKTVAIYAGAESVFAMTEGNPRWFIAIVGALLDRWQGARDERVPRNVQADELLRAAQRFAAMLRTIPVESELLTSRSRGLLSLVATLGQWFHEQVLGPDFSPEPAGTFIVDSNVSEALVVAVGQALNAGALVYVPDDSAQPILRSVRGKRFRISYLLAAQYGVPLRLGRPVSLRHILKSEGFLDFSDEQLTLS